MNSSIKQCTGTSLALALYLSDCVSCKIVNKYLFLSKKMACNPIRLFAAYLAS